MTQEEAILKANAKVRSYVEKANYRSAFLKAKQNHQRWPSSFLIRLTYAVMLGDYAEAFTGKKRRKMKSQSVARLKKLVLISRGQTFTDRYRARNEYYYHSRQYKKQYLLGLAGVRSGYKRAYFSQGVGAAWHALELANCGQKKRALRWAKISEKAWEQLFKINSSYYNSFIHYALALGLQGKNADAEVALLTAAKLSGQKTGFYEFEEIRAHLRSLSL